MHCGKHLLVVSLSGFLQMRHSITSWCPTNRALPEDFTKLVNEALQLQQPVLPTTARVDLVETRHIQNPEAQILPL
jgi:hypothetical protein